MNNELELILGLNNHKPKTKYVCFLPFIGEFGWYLMTYVKWVYGYNFENNKIVCCKPGHVSLFKNANFFFHDWTDIPDNKKAGICSNPIEVETIKQKITKQYGDSVTFLNPAEILKWDCNISLGSYDFIPKNKVNFDLKVDVVISPRYRQMDSFRNWPKQNWQYIISGLKENGYLVGLCGEKNTTYDFENIDVKSYDYIDVDTDIELLLNCNLFIGQESGMKYLCLKCKKPNIILDTMSNHVKISDAHMDKTIFNKTDYFRYWNSPQEVLSDALFFLQGNKK